MEFKHLKLKHGSLHHMMLRQKGPLQKEHCLRRKREKAQEKQTKRGHWLTKKAPLIIKRKQTTFLQTFRSQTSKSSKTEQDHFGPGFCFEQLPQVQDVKLFNGFESMSMFQFVYNHLRPLAAQMKY